MTQETNLNVQNVKKEFIKTMKWRSKQIEQDWLDCVDFLKELQQLMLDNNIDFEEVYDKISDFRAMIRGVEADNTCECPVCKLKYEEEKS